MYKGIVFDLDGTLVDSPLCFRTIRRELGIPEGEYILEHLETLAPEPRLIPEALEDRVLMFGLINELAGENGFTWNMRLRSMHRSLNDPAATDFQRQLVPVLAAKYAYDAALVDGARRQMVAIVERLRDQLLRQRAAARRYLIGDALSALDIYWATFAGCIDPLPEALCPNMLPEMRAAYTDAELKVVGGEGLFEHRDYIYRTWLKLPMDF